MKHSSRIMAILLAAMMLFSMAAAAADYTPKYEKEAEALKEMGLFLGTDQGFELDRAPNRAEALVMLIRLLGKEAEAKECTAETPLKDVEGQWMESYVAWAYTNDITKGVSADTFDYASEASAKMFLTFVLRALGYSDADGDFSYNAAAEKATEIGLIAAGEYTSDGFYRDDCVAVSYAALSANLKDSEQKLIDKLVVEGAVNEAAAEQCGFIKSEGETANEPAAEGSTVYFSMVLDGELKVTAQPVTVSADATVEDVIREAHKLYYSEGEAGFNAGTDATYGVYLIDTVWGVKGNPLVILNSAPLSAGENITNPFANVSKVMNGDNVIVNLNTNYFNPKPVPSIAISIDGDNAELTVITWTLQMDFSFKTAPMADCTLFDENGNELGKTDADGKATVKAEGIVCAETYAAVSIDRNAERERAVVEVSAGLTVETKQPVAGEADYVIACVGDSLTYGMGTTDPEEQSYPALLTKKDGAYLLATERYGHSGATVDNGFLAYTGTDEYRASLKTEADIVLFMLGTNDTMFSQDLNTFPQTYRALLDTYANLPCQPRIIIMLPPHFFDTNTEDPEDVNLETVIGYEKEIAEELGIPTIDVYTLTENKPEWSADGVHFTPEGYEIMADFVYGELCSILDSWK